MPLVAIDTFLDAVPITVAPASNNFATPIVGTPYLVAAGTASTFSNMAITKNDGWLECDSVGGTTTTATAKFASVRRPLADIYNITANSYLYGAVRIKKRTAYGAVANALVSFAHVDSPSSFFSLFTYVNLPDGGVIGKEYYLEWALDCTTWTFKRRVDGVQIADLVMGSGSHSNNFLAGKMSLQFGTANVAVQQVYHPPVDIKDVYFGERLAGETTDWLGDVMLVPLPVVSLAGSWTGNNGSGGAVDPVVALNTAVADQASFDAPYVVSDAAITEATLKVNTSPINGKVLALATSVVGKRQAGSMAALSHTVDADGATLNTTTSILAQSAMTPYSLRMMRSTPSGKPWSKQKLANMSIKLQAQ